MGSGVVFQQFSALYHRQGRTQPVEITLAKGKNVLLCSRAETAKGMSIKDFTLKPLK